MTLTNTVSTSNGDSKTGLFIEASFRIGDLITKGKVYVDLEFYNSEEAKNAGKDKFYAVGTREVSPTESEIPATVTEKVTNCTIDCSLNDAIKASGESKVSDMLILLLAKTKAKLEATYTWTITL